MSLDLYLVKEEPVLASWFAQPSCGRCGVRLSDKEPFATCAHCGALNRVEREAMNEGQADQKAGRESGGAEGPVDSGAEIFSREVAPVAKDSPACNESNHGGASPEPQSAYGLASPAHAPRGDDA